MTPEGGAAPAPAPVPPAVPLCAAGLVVLFAGAFVRLPVPLALAGGVCATAGAAWLALALRRWQLGLLALAMAYQSGLPLVRHESPPPGGASTLVLLAAYAALVFGGWWVGRRSAGS